VKRIFGCAKADQLWLTGIDAVHLMKLIEAELSALLQAVGTPQINSELRQLFLREWFCWKWTTRHGKYSGCRYWSERALQQCQDSGDSGLRHEHVVPRAEVARRLDTLLAGGAGAVELQEWLGRMCLGCVLTEEEDDQLGGRLTSRMPDGWDGVDPWARYRQAFAVGGIVIWEVGSDRGLIRRVDLGGAQ
jgi:hypothetical protein